MELQLLQQEMHRQFLLGRVDNHNLGEAIVYVAEEDNEIILMGAARLVWQFEPIMRVKKRDGRYASKASLRRATFLVFRELEGFVERSRSPVKTVIAFVQKRATWFWAEKMKFTHIYRHGRFYRKDY